MNALKELIDTRKTDALGKWFLDGLTKGDLSPLKFSDYPSIEVQLKDAYGKLEQSDQGKLSNAVVNAISRWNPDIDSINSLLTLATLSSYIREVEVIDYLRIIIEDRWLREKFKDKYHEILSILIAILSGFAPSEKVKRIFENLFFKDEANDDFMAHLFLGLCKCRPENFTQYVPRFLQVYRRSQRQNKQLFEMNFVVREFVRIVSKSTIFNSFCSLHESDQSNLSELLAEYTSDASYRSLPILCVPTLSPFDLAEEVASFRGKLMKCSHEEDGDTEQIYDRNALFEFITDVLRSKLHFQLIAVYLFSKRGKLYRAWLDGTGLDGNPVDHARWFVDESYDSNDDFFIARSAYQMNSNGFGTSHLIEKFDSVEVPQKFYSEYREKFGDLFCGMSFPLNGRNRTYGVVSVVNKIDIQTKKTISLYSFSRGDEYGWLANMRQPIAEAISDLRLNRQNNLRKELRNYLENSSCENDEKKQEVYNKIVERLTNKYTSFIACILRVKNTDSGKLVVVAKQGRDDVSVNDRVEEDIVFDDVETINDDNNLSKISDGLPQWSSKSKKPIMLIIDDNTISKFSSKQDWVKKHRLKSYACFPLISRGKIVGALSLYSGFEYQYYKGCIDFLEEICEIVAAFVRRSNEKVTIVGVKGSIKNVRDSLEGISEHSIDKLENTLDSAVDSLDSIVTEDTPKTVSTVD
jgi:hypothetical protein